MSQPNRYSSSESSYSSSSGEFYQKAGAQKIALQLKLLVKRITATLVYCDHEEGSAPSAAVDVAMVPIIIARFIVLV